ncbi:MAG: hypothetical protein HY855_05850 [Burkholderiales bacterium]|nr:hypothetical protein [Burkholderiales bacterium]
MRHQLLLTLPADPATMARRMAAAEVGDCLRMWAHDRGAADAQALWPSYARVAQALQRCATQVVALGGTVVQCAGLAALREALADEGALLTLVAHWKGARVCPFDLRDADALLAALGRQARGDPLLVRQLAGPAEIDALARAAMPPAARQAALAQALDTLVLDQDFLPPPAGQADDPDECREARNRQWLESVFPGALVPGNRLELWDRMVSADEFVAAVPVDRRAPIDLAVCHSAVLARRLQFERDGPVLVNRRPTGIIFRLTLHALAVEQVVRHGADYIEAALRLRAQLDPPDPPTAYRGSFA